MKRKFLALSIVAPSGQRIAQGMKTLEVRSWHPEQLPLKDLLLVENKNFLNHDADEEQGVAVALVDVESVHVWQRNEVEAACASYWAEGYFAWQLSNVRPIKNRVEVPAKRKIYLIEMDHA
ncbi:RNA-binding protein [Acinetobacter sp. ANC 4654]|uniref:ASCH domain-containing protein n=1 Tax=Acinetobacter sp. ANC 4654 TaxID=1977872 RepID=UPI000A33A459|nr:ASCH domain-containing protein [Acinetobacter sp. ANC 4654]OTG97185.1 RNA-binding protein [Acinetobacter sp. ANC 4654]